MSKPMSEREGNIAIVFALLTIPVLAIIAAATDLAGAYRERANMQDALDAAMLAAGRTEGTAAEKRKAAETIFFSRIAPLKVLGARFETGPGTDGGLAGNATALFPTRMLSLIRFNTIVINVHSEARELVVGDGHGAAIDG